MALTNCNECGHGHVCHLTPSEQERTAQRTTLDRVAQVIASVREGAGSWEAVEHIRVILRAEGVLPPPVNRVQTLQRTARRNRIIDESRVTVRGGGGGGEGVQPQPLGAPLGASGGGGAGVQPLGAPGSRLRFADTVMVSSDSWLEMFETRQLVEQRNRERLMELAHTAVNELVTDTDGSA